MLLLDLSVILFDSLSDPFPFYLDRVIKPRLYILMKLAMVKFLKFLFQFGVNFPIFFLLLVVFFYE